MAQSPAQALKVGRALTWRRSPTAPKVWCCRSCTRHCRASQCAGDLARVVVCRDGQRMAQLARALSFFGPDIEVMEFPAWDCQPYDRVSPNAAIVAQRMTTLSRLARVQGRDKPSILVTTANAITQRVPAP